MKELYKKATSLSDLEELFVAIAKDGNLYRDGKMDTDILGKLKEDFFRLISLGLIDCKRNSETGEVGFIVKVKSFIWQVISLIASWGLKIVTGLPPIKSLEGLAVAFINHEKNRHREGPDAFRTVYINTKTFGPLDFGISEEDKVVLKKEGSIGLNYYLTRPHIYERRIIE